MMDAIKVIKSHSLAPPIDIFGAMREIGLVVKFRPEPENLSGWIEKMSSDKYGSYQ